MSTSQIASDRPAEPAEHPTTGGGINWRLLLVLVVLVAIAATAAVLITGSETRDGPPLVNGDFETGDFSEWATASWGAGAWLIYEDGTTPPDPSITDQNRLFNVPDPPQGRYAAVTDMHYSSVNFLYRDIDVTAPMALHATVFYENEALKNHTPPDFGNFDGEAWFANIRNQQFRIDLIDPGANIYSAEANDVLATVFRTEQEDSHSMGPTPISFDLSPWEGQTIRLRITQIDNLEAFRAGIDDVWLEWLD